MSIKNITIHDSGFDLFNLEVNISNGYNFLLNTIYNKLIDNYPEYKYYDFNSLNLNIIRDNIFLTITNDTMQYLRDCDNIKIIIDIKKEEIHPSDDEDSKSDSDSDTNSYNYLPDLEDDNITDDNTSVIVNIDGYDESDDDLSIYENNNSEYKSEYFSKTDLNIKQDEILEELNEYYEKKYDSVIDYINYQYNVLRTYALLPFHKTLYVFILYFRIYQKEV